MTGAVNRQVESVFYCAFSPNGEVPLKLNEFLISQRFLGENRLYHKKPIHQHYLLQVRTTNTALWLPAEQEGLQSRSFAKQWRSHLYGFAGQMVVVANLRCKGVASYSNDLQSSNHEYYNLFMEHDR